MIVLPLLFLAKPTPFQVLKFMMRNISRFGDCELPIEVIPKTTTSLLPLSLHQRPQNRQAPLLRLHRPAPSIIVRISRRRCRSGSYHPRLRLVRHVRAAPKPVVWDALVPHICRIGRLAVVCGRLPRRSAPGHAKVTRAVAGAVRSFGVVPDPVSIGGAIDGVLGSEVRRGFVGDTFSLADG